MVEQLAHDYANRVRADRTEGLELGAAGSACRGADRSLASADSREFAGRPVAGDLTVVGGGPTGHRHHRIHQGPAQIRQLVLHSRRDLGVRGPRDQSISLEVLERLGQHPLRDPGNARL